jgi:hypothetical protein
MAIIVIMASNEMIMCIDENEIIMYCLLIMKIMK